MKIEQLDNYYIVIIELTKINFIIKHLFIINELEKINLNQKQVDKKQLI